MVLKTGTVTSESSNLGRGTTTPVIGGSGAALIAPQASGKADLYGMMTASSATYGVYEPYDWIKSGLGLMVTCRFLSFVIIAFLLTGSSAFLVADVYAASLYKQIQNRAEGQILYCNNPDHLLVLRDNLKLACVYPETAIKKSWHPVVFDGNGNVTVSDSVNVRAHEKDYRISYTVTEGLLNDAWYDPDWDALFLEIHSQGSGGMELSVPKQFFEPGGFFMVLENGEEVAFTSLQDGHNDLLQFNFTHPDPVVEVLWAFIP